MSRFLSSTKSIYIYFFDSSTYPVPWVVSTVQFQQGRGVFSQDVHLLPGLGQLVPAQVQLFELMQPSEPM